MEGSARLGDFTGLGILKPETTESGESLLTGLWRADDPEQAYDALHRLYMARESIVYEGPAAEDELTPPQERSLEVIILEWSNEEHPAALKLQEAVETPA